MAGRGLVLAAGSAGVVGVQGPIGPLDRPVTGSALPAFGIGIDIDIDIDINTDTGRVGVLGHGHRPSRRRGVGLRRPGPIRSCRAPLSPHSHDGGRSARGESRVTVAGGRVVTIRSVHPAERYETRDIR